MMLCTASLLLLGATQTLELEAFDRVASAAHADLRVDVDPDAKAPYRVVIEGEQEELDRLEVEVDDGRLEIGTKRGSWNWSRGARNELRIRTTVKALKEIVTSGSGDTVVRGLRGERFECKASGSGDIELAGTIGDLTLELAGSGDIEATTLEAREVTVKLAGSGSVDLEGRADRLVVKIAGSGDVDAGGLSVTDVVAKVLGSGDATVCASGDVSQSTMGSGNVRNACD